MNPLIRQLRMVLRRDVGIETMRALVEITLIELERLETKIRDKEWDYQWRQKTQKRLSGS